ncbi:MAG: hypothetical protein ACE5JG_00910 [Planctomycetota bacterium]
MTLLGVESTALRWHALPQLWILFLVLLPLLAGAVFLLYRRDGERVASGPRRLMAVLRLVTVALVLAALFGPYAETVEGRYFKRHLILCVDTSRSMEFSDTYLDAEQRERVRRAAGWPEGEPLHRHTRLEIVRGLLTRNRGLLRELADKFRLHVYTFDEDLAGLVEPRQEEGPQLQVERIVREVQGLRPEGAITRLGLALRKLVRAFAAHNEPVAGVVLFTDGRHTGGAPEPVSEARRAAQGTREGIPIYPVAVGDPGAARNIGVSRIDAPEVVLAGDEVQFSVTVHARGFEGRTAWLEVDVVDTDGTVVERLPVDAPRFELPGDDEPGEVSFTHLFDRPGSYALRIGVPPQPGEAVRDDNFRRHHLRVVREKVQVLYAAARPFNEYRFLKEALIRAEDTIEAHILLLSADAGWPQEASPGLDPVTAFPADQRALARYDVVILGDVPPSHEWFSPPHAGGAEGNLRRLEKWVTRGGGLVLQAGPDHLPSQWEGTRLMALLPVVPGRDDDAVILRRFPKYYRLTLEGRDHAIMRVLQDPARVREFWERGVGREFATYYYWYHPAARAKSGATVLAVRQDDDRIPYRADDEEPAHPLIAIQEYGAGKVLWIATDELWRLRDGVENLYYWRFWSGAIRHLATYNLLSGNRRTKIFVDRPDGRYRVGDDVLVEAKFLDENFEPVVPRDEDPGGSTRVLHLVAPDGEDREIVLQAIPEEPPRGRFQMRIRAGRPGIWRLYAEPEGEEERAERSFTVEETSLEMRDPLLDVETLRAVARESGGRVLGPAAFLKVLDDEILATGGILRSGERSATDLWDRAWVLWLLVGLLAVEWILRKRNRLL